MIVESETDPFLSKKVEEKWAVVRIPSTGLLHFTGISSSYSTQYPVILQGVISNVEFVDIIERLNETIRDYWPCDTCYYFGYGCSVCSLGLSILLPHYCATHSELYATAMLKNVSLKSKYYDRRITFTLVKSWCKSYVEIRMPSALMDVEMLSKQADNKTTSAISITTTTTTHTHSDDHRNVITSLPLNRENNMDIEQSAEAGPFIAKQPTGGTASPYNNVRLKAL